MGGVRLRFVALLLVTGGAAQAQKPPARVEFLRDVAPILDRSGCSTAACHGKFGGRGGFQLSLLTLSPEDDYAPIVYGERGRRVNFAEPHRSLLLLKASGRIPHGGGPRFSPTSPEYQTIARWIQQGAPFSDSDPRLVRLEVQPKKATLPRVGAKQQLKVIAAYTDGSRRDVTRQAVYESTNSAVIEISPTGEALGRRWGGGAVIARYLGTVTAAFFTLPQARKGPPQPPAPPGANVIDRLVFANLRSLNVIPSGACTDNEFARRATLDTLGRLPTVEEMAAYSQDAPGERRAKLIDRLLDSPEFVDYRTMKLADLLRVHPRQLGNNTLAERAAALFWEWIWKSVAENKRWDQFVREIITARGSTYQVGPANFYRIERTANDRMENIGQAFLGVRMSCARCHKHPFDRWTTDDYWSFAAFTAKMQLRGGRLLDESIVQYAHGAELRNQSVTGKNRGRVAPAVYLGEKGPAPQSDDMIAALADWVTSPRNPFFARATVNRLWAQYFGRGIVHPVDDMRETTPESVPGLLDALAAELTRSGFDIKHMIRLMLSSRTYQLSAVPNSTNVLDDRFFSRFYPRPMPAEALLDMMNQAAGFQEQLGTWPERSRAVQAMLPPQNYFLTVFGQSHRQFLADLDPRLEPNLVQTLTMINSPYVENKVRNGAVVQEVLKETGADEELVRRLYARTLNRPPSPAELKRALAIASSRRPQKGEEEKARRELAEDLLWALITSREFYFNH